MKHKLLRNSWATGLDADPGAAVTIQLRLLTEVLLMATMTCMLATALWTTLVYTSMLVMR